MSKPRLLSRRRLTRRIHNKAQTQTATARAIVAALRADALAKGYSSGVANPPYDPRVFASILGAKEIRAADLNFDGRVAAIDDEITVEYSRESQSTHRWRFTIAHEVAHLALWQQRGIPAKQRRQSASGRHVESLCDDIAAELLAPSDEVAAIWTLAKQRVRADQRASAAETIQDIAQHFHISLHMAAVRFSEVCVHNAGAGLFSLKERTFIWRYAIPGFRSAVDMLISCLTEKRPIGQNASAESYSYSASYGIRYARAEWRKLNSDLVLVVVTV